MDNILWGIVTIIFCTTGYFFAWKQQSKNNFAIAILLLIICGLALRIYMSTDFFLHEWDERFHALVAKNLIQHPLIPTLYDNPVLPYDYKNWAANHIWVHKQPLPLWAMAASMWIFGVNEIALRLPSILLTTLGIWLIYKIGIYFFNQKVGFLAAFFYSINGQIIELTGGRLATDHTDIFFLFFVELAVFFIILFIQKKKPVFNLLVGVSIGAAILSKWLPALIILPVWLLMIIHSKKLNTKEIVIQFILLVLSCIAVFLPWQLYIYHAFPVEANWETTFNLKHITEALDGQTGPLHYFVDRIRINYGDLIYLPLGWFVWKIFKNSKDFNRFAIFIWFFIPFLFFSFTKTKLPAYLLFTSPALFLMTAEFWIMLTDYRKNHNQKWFINLILILFIAFPVRFTIERMKPFLNRDRNPQWVADIKKLNDRKIKNGVLLNYEKAVEAMFYTDFTVYQYMPDKNQIINLIEKGYVVFINDNGAIPADIKSMDGVTIENLTYHN